MNAGIIKLKDMRRGQSQEYDDDAIDKFQINFISKSLFTHGLGVIYNIDIRQLISLPAAITTTLSE